MENKEELELLKMLDEAEEDVRNGKVSSIESTFDEIRKKLNTFVPQKQLIIKYSWFAQSWCSILYINYKITIL